MASRRYPPPRPERKFSDSEEPIPTTERTFDNRYQTSATPYQLPPPNPFNPNAYQYSPYTAQNDAARDVYGLSDDRSRGAQPNYHSLYERSYGSPYQRTEPHSNGYGEQTINTMEQERLAANNTGQPQGHHALLDYQAQMTLLEQQNRTRSTMAGQEDESVAPSTNSTDPAYTSSNRQYHCNYTPCVSSFARKADLTRHIECVHEKNAEKKYSCPVKKCIRKGANGFSRKDHRTEHLRHCHHRDIPKKVRRGATYDEEEEEDEENGY